MTISKRVQVSIDDVLLLALNYIIIIKYINNLIGKSQVSINDLILPLNNIITIKYISNLIGKSQVSIDDL